MKKALALILALCMILTNLSSVFADETPGIEISFKVGDKILKINGTAVEVETTPYVVDGVTLVPVRVITESFGAKVEWEGDTQKITLTYEDVTIILHIDDKFAYVNTQKQELLYPPQLTGSVTMVPLRFITESFGADVNYDDATEQITILKSTESDKPVSDISDILRSSDKNIVGDSYYGWSVNRTSEMELSYRSFDGRSNYFDFGENIALNIKVLNNTEDDSMEQIKAKEMETARSFTFVSQKQLKTASGISYIQTQYKDSKDFCDRRAYLYKDKIYSVSLFIDNSLSTAEKDKYISISDSFDLRFSKESTEDLSDVENNMRLFDQKDFNISFRIPADWIDASDENTINKFLFLGFDKDDKIIGSVSLGIFSKDDNIVKEWANRDLTRNRRQINPDLYTYSSLIEMPMGEQTATYYISDSTTNGVKSTGKDIFWEYNEYIYNLHIETLKSDEKIMEEILRTVKYEPIDYSRVGILELEKWPEDEDSVISTKKNTTDKYSIGIPSTWSSNDDNSGFFDSKKGIEISIMRVDLAVSMSDVRTVVDNVRKDSNNKITKELASVPNDNLSKKGWTAYEFEFTFKTNDSTIYCNQTAINTGKVSYVITTIYPEMFYSEATKETVAKIIKSFTLN